MYIPPHFEETRIEVLHRLIRARPLATLVTFSSAGIIANHIPLHLSEEPFPLGTLQGHVARANPIWSDINNDIESLAIFHGPGAYITPSWYPTKAQTGKAVPTWNYVVAHAYGKIRIVDDPAWLHRHLEALTNENEATRSEPWQVSDAPEDFVDRLLGSIVGIEIGITRLVGKWKISQNQPPQNQAGVIQGLLGVGTTDTFELASLMERTQK